MDGELARLAAPGSPSGAQKRALERIEGELRPGEEPVAVLLGQAENARGRDSTVGALVLTNQRLTYQGSLMGKSQSASFALADVDSIVVESGLLLARVVITVAGNRFVVDKTHKAMARDFVDTARRAIESAPRGGSQPPASLADELGKLAALRDSGVLSDDEFQAAKGRLIG